MPKISEINGKPQEFLDALKEFCLDRKGKGFLLLSGTNGNGKTFSARAIYDLFWHPHSGNQFWNQAKLNMTWQEEFTERGHTNMLLAKLLEAPLLVLDDIGTRKPSDSFMDFLYWISEERFEKRNELGTIITTNLTPEAMSEMFGFAFVSRISSGICVRHNGPDRRGMRN